MKLSFSLSSKPTLKPGRTAQNFSEGILRRKDEDKYKQEYVTEYNPSISSIDNGNITVPSNQDGLRPMKKMKNLDLPLQASSQLSFEVEPPPSEQHHVVSNGLNLRKKLEGNSDPKEPFSTSIIIGASRTYSRESLPEVPGSEDFDDVPVENYGASLLGSLGWHEGQGIGRRTRNDVEVREYTRWDGRKALGYIADMPIEKETMEKREKEEKKENKLKSGAIRSRGGSKSWLRSNIRVRVISKKLKGGKLYLKKGVVVDVVGPTTCDISLDDTGELVQGLDQNILETALPRRGGRVLVLFGKYEGILGNLVERRLDERIGVVEDVDNRARFTVRVEHMAEYVGDPGLLDYS